MAYDFDKIKRDLEIKDDIDTEVLANALRSFRDEKFANMILIAIELVAISNPNELRKSLSRVFDLKKVEEQFDRAIRMNAGIYDEIARSREELAIVTEELNRAKGMLEDVRFETEQLKLTVEAIRKWLRGHVKPLFEQNGVYRGEQGEGSNRSGDQGAGGDG